MQEPNGYLFAGNSSNLLCSSKRCDGKCSAVSGNLCPIWSSGLPLRFSVTISGLAPICLSIASTLAPSSITNVILRNYIRSSILPLSRTHFCVLFSSHPFSLFCLPLSSPLNSASPLLSLFDLLPNTSCILMQNCALTFSCPC